MRAYHLVSAFVFLVLAVAQLARFLYGWPVTVAGVSIPVWVSAIAAVVIGALAAWGLQLILLLTTVSEPRWEARPGDRDADRAANK